MIKFLEWSATVVLIVGTGFNSAGFYPIGPILLIAGGVLWLIVSIAWRKAALIVTNTVMLVTGLAGLWYNYSQ